MVRIPFGNRRWSLKGGSWVPVSPPAVEVSDLFVRRGSNLAARMVVESLDDTPLIPDLSRWFCKLTAKPQEVPAIRPHP